MMELPLIKVLKPAGFQLCCIATHTATRYSVDVVANEQSVTCVEFVVYPVSFCSARVTRLCW